MTDPVEIAAAVLCGDECEVAQGDAYAVLAALHRDGWRLVRTDDGQRLTSGGTHQERAWITEEWSPDE